MSKEKMFAISVVVVFTLLAILSYPSIGLLPVASSLLTIPYLVVGLIIFS